MRKLLLILLCVPLIGFGQDSSYIFQPMPEYIILEKIEKIPEYHLTVDQYIHHGSSSLEDFTPSALYQGHHNMCLSYALSTIRTIIYAYDNNITNIDTIDHNRFSPFFIYYMAHGSKNRYEKRKCKKPLGIRESINIIGEYGIPKSSNVEYPYYYPYTEDRLCSCYPTTDSLGLKEDLYESYLYRLDAERIDVDNLSGKDFVNTIKSLIIEDRPCLLGTLIPEKWYHDKKGRKNYGRERVSLRGKKGKESGHAMVIIGWDDSKFGGAFQIMNSWGSNWGVDGKAWIKYSEFRRFRKKMPVYSFSSYSGSTEEIPTSLLNDLESQKPNPKYKYINSSNEKQCVVKKWK